MEKVIYPDLSYKIVGLLYEVYNNLGYGHREKTYQQAIAEEFKENGIIFKKELYFPVYYKKTLVSKYYLDFVIDDKIILEVKVAKDFYQTDINQILAYLKAKNYRLGILAIFTQEKVLVKRILN